MPTERELAISPIVQESVQHNTQVHEIPYMSLGPYLLRTLPLMTHEH